MSIKKWWIKWATLSSVSGEGSTHWVHPREGSNFPPVARSENSLQTQHCCSEVEVGLVDTNDRKGDQYFMGVKVGVLAQQVWPRAGPQASTRPPPHLLQDPGEAACSQPPLAALKRQLNIAGHHHHRHRHQEGSGSQACSHAEVGKPCSGEGLL